MASATACGGPKSGNQFTERGYIRPLASRNWDSLNACAPSRSLKWCAVKGKPVIDSADAMLDDLPRQRLAIASIGEALKETLQVPRLVSLSVHDVDGDLLWLSESLLGPDEHGVILDGIDELRAAGKQEHVQRDMGDGLQATVLAARTDAGRLGAVVLAMSMSPWRAPRGSRSLLDDAANGALRRIAAIALLSKAPEAAPVAVPAAAPAVSQSPPTLVPASRAPAPRRAAVAAVLAADVHFHLVRDTSVRLEAGRERGLVRVRGRSARNDGMDLAVSAASDRIVFAELVRLLEREAAAGSGHQDLHVLRLSEASLQDPGFLRYAAMRLQNAPQIAEQIGFAVDDAVLRQSPVAIGGFFEGCERLGCSVIVEGFTMQAESLPVIATKALRAISFRLPADRRDGKPSRAARAYAAAMTIFCKAMKVACIAQTGKPEAHRRWLARIGVAYVE